MWKIISVVFFSGLLIFACIAIYFNDKKIISRETLFDNVPFTKKLFSDKKIDNIVFNIDTNKITVYFPSDQYMDIFDFFKNGWDRTDFAEYIKFSNKDFIIFLEINLMEININR